MNRRPVRLVAVALFGIASLARADAVGPLKVGDAVEVTYGGKWQPGTVTAAEGLTYFVHWGTPADNGKFDRFYQLHELRLPGAPQTLAAAYHDATPDPAGGPLAIGEAVEAEFTTRWAAARVVRRLGADRYVVIPDDVSQVAYTNEAWVGLDKLRKRGTTQPLGAAPAAPAKPTKLAEVHAGDRVEAWRRGGYGWMESKVMAIDPAGRFYVQTAADSSARGWVPPVHMRAVGSTERFEPERLEQFVGEWRLSGDAFFTTRSSVNKGDHIEKTMELNSGAGQDAGRLSIRPDGTYTLSKTAIYRDDKPGQWVRNPDQGEGGILLKDAESDGKDCCVTPYPGGGIYLQGSLRGPGKIGTK